MSPASCRSWSREQGWLLLLLPEKQQPWMEISGLPQRGTLPLPGFCPSPLAWLLTPPSTANGHTVQPYLSPLPLEGLCWLNTYGRLGLHDAQLCSEMGWEP